MFVSSHPVYRMPACALRRRQAVKYYFLLCVLVEDLVSVLVIVELLPRPFECSFVTVRVRVTSDW